MAEKVITLKEFNEAIDLVIKKYENSDYLDPRSHLVQFKQCPVCHELGDGEIFEATHFSQCTYLIGRIDYYLTNKGL